MENTSQSSESGARSVGFVGLGAMGGPLTARLLSAGHEVHGYNRHKDKAAELIEDGLVWQDSPRALAEAVDVVFSMVSNDAALDAITAGPDGILAGLTEGKVYVDMSTVKPETSVALADRVREAGARMLDAPVSGSVPQAEDGTLTIMVGGDSAAFDVARPFLEVLGKDVFHVGSNGKGLFLKLAINVNLAAQLIALAEGLVLAERAGIDPKVATEVISKSPIGSASVNARIPFMLELPERGWFDVGLMHKDVRLALAAAQQLEVPAPSAQVADTVLGTADVLGYGTQDVAVVHRVLARYAPEPTALPDPPSDG